MGGEEEECVEKVEKRERRKAGTVEGESVELSLRSRETNKKNLHFPFPAPA